MQRSRDLRWAVKQPSPDLGRLIEPAPFLCPCSRPNRGTQHALKGRLSHRHHPTNRRGTRDHRAAPIAHAGLAERQRPRGDVEPPSQQPCHGKAARFYISEIGDDTAKFTVLETMIDPHWPSDQEPLQPEVGCTWPCPIPLSQTSALQSMRKRCGICCQSNKFTSRARQNSSRQTPVG